MAKAEPPVSDLWVAREAATFYLDGAVEVQTWPGMLVHRTSAILAARSQLFEPLVIAVIGVEDEPGTAGVATVLVISDKGEGLGQGSEMVTVKRWRTREGPKLW